MQVTPIHMKNWKIDVKLQEGVKNEGERKAYSEDGKEKDTQAREVASPELTHQDAKKEKKITRQDAKREEELTHQGVKGGGALPLVKVVQGFNESFDYLNDSLKPLFVEIKKHFGHLAIRNVVFREINGQLVILFHFPNFQPNLATDFYMFSWPNYVKSVQIHPHDNYQRNLPRISLFGSDVMQFSLNNRLFHCTVDSFLQPNLIVCQKMYQFIEDSLQMLISPTNNVTLAGIGDDTLNLANYLRLPSTHFLHCHDTLKVGLSQIHPDINCQATVNLDIWIQSCQEKKPTILLITPGRKGLKANEIQAILRLNFQHIIYLACCPEVLPKDFQFFSNEYEICSTTEFPMYQTRPIVSKKYQETVQIWIVKPSYFNYSIGEDCCVQYHLNDHQTLYSPLSWCRSHGFDVVVELFETRFRELLVKENWKMQKTSDQFMYIQNETDVPDETLELAIYQVEVGSKQKKLTFPHQIRSKYIESDLDKCLDQMQRRIDRLYQNPNRIRLFRYESKPQQINKNNLERLLKFCAKLIIITPFPEKLSVKHDKLVIWPDIHYQSHTDWKRWNRGSAPSPFNPLMHKHFVSLLTRGERPSSFRPPDAQTLCFPNNNEMLCELCNKLLINNDLLITFYSLKI